MDPEFWAGKRVFLTGHTGFKGSWLALWLQHLGARVTGFALPPDEPSLFDRANVADSLNSVIGDVRDLDALRRAMSAAQPEVVMHMAAQSLVRYSYQHPVETYATNVMGTVHLLEAVRESTDVKAVVVVTTDKCYENKEWVWGYREEEPMGGFDPYSNSKGCAELVTSSYRSSFFNPPGHGQHNAAIATARAGNVIGGGDWATDRLIPDILRAFSQGQPALIRNPDAVRPWQHVLEPLRGYLVLAQLLYTKGAGFAEAWNFGPNDADTQPVSWVAQQMARLWGEGASWRHETGANPHEANYLKLDISKARSRLAWQPVISLSEALAMTVDWADDCRRGGAPREVTLRQIEQFQTRLGANPRPCVL